MKPFSFLPLILLPFYVISQPVGYYNGTEGLYGEDLKAKLNQIISGQYYYSRNSSGGTSNVWFNNSNDSYSNAKLVFGESDADPNTADHVIDLYRGKSYHKDNYGTAAGTLNREHVWAKSHGSFSESSAMYCDYHNLKPSEAAINRKKSNLDFDEGGVEFEDSGCFYTSNSWEPRDPVKGDVSRIVFYMATRYQGASGEIKLDVVNSLNTYPQPKHGKLDALYAWNTRDLPDDFELNRNETLYKYQGNRNPYIDNPYWIEMIWGDKRPSSVLIGNMSQTPLIATSYNPVEISAAVSNISSSASVQLLWGTSYDDLGNSAFMDKEGNVWIAQIPSQAENTTIYLRVAVEDNGMVTESVSYNYTVYGTLPIARIQGTEEHSPYEGQTVSAIGIVTASYSDGYYIQDDINKRSGIYVYDSKKPMIGSLVQVSGTVADYYGLTEIKDVSGYKLLQVRVPVPEAIVISASQATKDYQSMFVKVINASCTSLPDANNNWGITDNSGTMMVHNNSSYSFSPTANETYNVQGVLNYSYETWRIELRKSGDVEVNTGIETVLEDSGNIFVFPNPAEDILHLKVEEEIAGNSVLLSIYSTDGRLHYSENVTVRQLNDGHSIHIDKLPAGIWILSVQHTKDKISRLFIKR